MVEGDLERLPEQGRGRLPDVPPVIARQAHHRALDLGGVRGCERREEERRELLVGAPRVREEPCRPIAADDARDPRGVEDLSRLLDLRLAHPAVLPRRAEDRGRSERVALLKRLPEGALPARSAGSGVSLRTAQSRDSSRSMRSQASSICSIDAA